MARIMTPASTGLRSSAVLPEGHSSVCGNVVKLVKAHAGRESDRDTTCPSHRDAEMVYNFFGEPVFDGVEGRQELRTSLR